MDTLAQILELLQMLSDDSSVPKNAKVKISNTVELLQNGNGKIGVSKAMHEIETLSDDVNMPAHLRTQLFQVVSLLEIV